MITVGNDKTFAVWNVGKRDDKGLPLFVRRVEIENKVPKLIDINENSQIG